MSNDLEERIAKLEAGLTAVEAHLVKLPAGTTRFVPGGVEQPAQPKPEQPKPEQPAEKPTLWEQVTAELTHKQVDALKAAGLITVKSLQAAAADEDGFTRLDGLGKAADTTLRKALEGLR